MKISFKSARSSASSWGLSSHGRRQVLGLISCLLIVSVGQASTSLFQASFEKGHGDWTIIRGRATPDSRALHSKNTSLRIERDAVSQDTCVGFTPVTLTMGRRYELSGWVRTEALQVHDIDRSPIASGATLTMASMPFDVHSESVGGTQPWTHLRLRFIASRARDQILLTVGNGGTFNGTASFEGIQLDAISSDDQWPVREAVETFGPAYRYPAAGWIYLHIEGKPYERGYQHGHLMAREIPEYFERCASLLGSKEHWDVRFPARALSAQRMGRENKVLLLRSLYPWGEKRGVPAPPYKLERMGEPALQEFPQFRCRLELWDWLQFLEGGREGVRETPDRPGTELLELRLEVQVMYGPSQMLRSL